MKPYSLIPLAFIIPLFIKIQASSCPNLINSSCLTLARDDPNIKYAFCTTSLQAAPASHCATLNGLGKILITLIGHNLTDTRCYIKQLMECRKLDPDIKKCLHVCEEVFSDNAVKNAMQYYKAKRFYDVNEMLSAILTFAGNCEDCFREGKTVVSPLTNRNDDVFQLTVIALNVVATINHTGSG